MKRLINWLTSLFVDREMTYLDQEAAACKKLRSHQYFIDHLFNPVYVSWAPRDVIVPAASGGEAELQTLLAWYQASEEVHSWIGSIWGDKFMAEHEAHQELDDYLCPSLVNDSAPATESVVVYASMLDQCELREILARYSATSETPRKVVLRF